MGGISFHILIGNPAWPTYHWQASIILTPPTTLATWASDFTDQLVGRGWAVEGRRLYMADH